MFKKNYEALKDWSVTAVDELIKINSDYKYKFVLTINPNPSDCKGVHDIQMSVWRQYERYDRNLPTHELSEEFIKSNHHGIIENCMKDITNKIFPLLQPNQDVIERNGKKFKLVEIK